MKRIATAVIIVGTFALTASPAMAMHKAEHTPGPQSGNASKANAYGKFCQGQSKEHVQGVKGTAFSNCVNAMAKAAKGEAKPRAACKLLSKKHVKGEKGTPFSRCVVSAKKVKKEAAATV